MLLWIGNFYVGVIGGCYFNVVWSVGFIDLLWCVFFVFVCRFMVLRCIDFVGFCGFYCGDGLSLLGSFIMCLSYWNVMLGDCCGLNWILFMWMRDVGIFYGD